MPSFYFTKIAVFGMMERARNEMIQRNIKMKNQEYSLSLMDNRRVFREGIKEGLPIGLGYFAVSFSLGIMAKRAGLNPFQSFLASLLCNASAGEYAAFSLIMVQASYIEVAIITFIANARYLLMSCVLSQKMKPETTLMHRLLVGYDVTDEIFAISVGRKGILNPNYTYGAIVVAAPCWAIGTSLGCIAGNIMPIRLVSAFSVALYGMFLAIIIPPARKSKVVAGVVVVSFLCSYLVNHLSVFSKISSGTRTIILTVVISVVAAICFPHTDEEVEDES